MAKQVLHMIGNAHIDPVWLWQWQEGFQEVKATFRSALDRLNETDEFLFISSSSIFYLWIEQNAPEMFEEIKQRVGEGRWEIVGGWLIQPDCNIPGGESFVRQGLYGQRYFYEKFGVVAKVGYNVDSFGHHGMLPQILKKSGMDYYVFMRPGPHEKGLPGNVFWWESDDESRVLAARILFEYCTWSDDLRNHVVRSAEQLRDPVNQLMCFYGVGNHGGGPTKANLESIRTLANNPLLPELRFSTPNRYFDALLAETHDFPSVHDDLQHHASGCYAVHSGIKRWNRRAEQALITAEKWSIMADWIVGQPYPEQYTEAWRSVLFNQFHDILAGTSIEPAYETARDAYGSAMTIAERGCNNAIQSLSWKIHIKEEEGMRPIVVFNAHSWVVQQSVEVEFANLPPSPILVDPDDVEIPFQEISPQSATHMRKRVAFLADLPPLGYKVYRMKSGAGHTLPNNGDWTANDTAMENAHLRIQFDPTTGFISSLYDKQQDHEVLSGAAARPVVLEDLSDTWSHGVLRFDKEVGTFQATSVRLISHGPIESVIRVTSEYAQSIITQDFTLFRDFKQVKVNVIVDWRQRFQALKLKFPVNLQFVTATYEIPYGHIVRPVDGAEEPGQSWIDLTGIAKESGDVYGLSLLNDGKYSFDIDGSEMGMTVLRSPLYAHHEPFVPEEGSVYPFIDHGIQQFSYSLLPHASGWQDAGTVMRAAEMNQAPTVIVETYHDGPLPQCDGFIDVSVQNVIVTAMKLAEDGQDMIIRCRETSRLRTIANIGLPKWGREISTEFCPCEIKTFLVPKDQSKPVCEVNLLEWETKDEK